jgi:hypothetical protein
VQAVIAVKTAHHDSTRNIACEYFVSPVSLPRDLGESPTRLKESPNKRISTLLPVVALGISSLHGRMLRRSAGMEHIPSASHRGELVLIMAG